MQLTADALDLLLDVDDFRLEVDVLPAEPENLAATQAIEKKQDERRV